MTMDPGLQAFAVESRELLEEMEDLLLQLEDQPEDADIINELFRAVHTIKCASGMFGFDAVVEFTHLGESVMGRLRDSEIKATDELLTLLLASKDHIALLVDVALDGDGNLSEESIASGKSLSAQLELYLHDTLDGSADALGKTPEVMAETDNPDGPKVENAYWHISLRFGNDVLRNGMDPSSFIRYLETIGDIVSLVLVDDNMPAPNDMDAESCYLGFEIDLNSEANKEDIEAVFEFVQDDCVIHILPPPHSYVARYVELIEGLPEQNYQIGEMLVRSRALTERELAEILKEQKQQQVEAEQQGEEHPQPFGELAVKQGVVEKPVVEAALDKQKTIKKHQSEENQIVRVNADNLEELINLVGELVISGANTHLLARQSGDSRLTDATENMSVLVEEIRDTTLGLRMVQIGQTFNRFRRVVREVSREMGKEIELIIGGGDTELDKTVVDKMADPLMHLVRNAIDHGIEAPQSRTESGKPSVGTVSLKAYHDSGSIVIEISDDGHGLSKDRIFAKAVEKGLINASTSLSDQEIYRLIFEPGFSTVEQVTNLSGRGVGMDVVRRNIEALRGQVEVESTLGKGSKFTIRLPLTLAIIDGFLVQVGKSSYVIPLDMVDECVEFNEAANETYENSHHINLRGKVLPYVRLAELFNVPRTASKGGKKRENIVVTRFAGQKAGLVVDDLLGEYQTVIKPLGKVFENLKGLSGATILGSGEVAMIVDVPALVSTVSSHNTQRLESNLNGGGKPH